MMQQATIALHRLRFPKLFRAIFTRLSDVAVVWRLEKSRELLRRFLDAPLARMFNIVEFTLPCLEQPFFE
jgi:hypothetical protein